MSKLVNAEVFTEIEKSFVQKPVMKTKTRKVADVIELLDPKKAHNMSIFLTGLPKGFEIHQIANYVMEMSPLIETEHVLENLLKFAPGQEEVASLKAYSGDKSKLSKPDQLVWEMIQIEQFKERVGCLLYKTLFWDTIESIEKVTKSTIKKNN